MVIQNRETQKSGRTEKKLAVTRITLDRTLWPAVILLAAVILLFEITPLDLWLQDHFYNPRSEWLIDSKEPTLRALFYSGPKRLLYLFGAFLVAACFGPARIRERLISDPGQRRDWIVVLATLISAPLLISTSKSVTHVFCPFELVRYGGKHDYKPICEFYTDQDRPSEFGRGFPAGHASGGFALLSLAGIGRSRGTRLTGLAVGIAAGGLMGTYQILKGAHFLSHTLVTALVCWIVFLILHRLISHRPPSTLDETANAALLLF